MNGFTLLETLCALAVFGFFLTGLWQAERTYFQASESIDLALRMQQKQAVSELLRAEVGMAGYRHAGPDISAVSDGSTDRLTFAYLEDRIAGAPTVRTVTFDAGLDREGTASLYRKENTGYRQPAVLGLRELRIVGWTDASGTFTLTPASTVTSVTIELVFAWGERDQITIGFLNHAGFGSVGAS